MTRKLENGEFEVLWTCPECKTHQVDSVHPEFGPYASCICSTCGQTFYDQHLSKGDAEAWDEARTAAENETV